MYIRRLYEINDSPAQWRGSQCEIEQGVTPGQGMCGQLHAKTNPGSPLIAFEMRNHIGFKIKTHRPVRIN